MVNNYDDCDRCGSNEHQTNVRHNPSVYSSVIHYQAVV